MPHVPGNPKHPVKLPAPVQIPKPRVISPEARARIRELEEALSAAQENNARLATALNAAQSELMRRESY